MSYSSRVIICTLSVLILVGCSDSNSRLAVSNQPQGVDDVSQVVPEIVDGDVPEDLFHLTESESASCDISLEPTVHGYEFEVRGAEFIFYITLEKNQGDVEVGARWIAAQIEQVLDENGEPTQEVFVVYAPFTESIDQSVVVLATTPHNEIETEEFLRVALIRMSASGELCWTDFKTQRIIVSDHLSGQTDTQDDSAQQVSDDSGDSVSDDTPAQEVLSVQSEDRSHGGHEYFVVSVGLRLLDPMYVCIARERDGEQALLINAGSHIGLLPEGESYVEFWINHDEVSLNDADALFLMGSPDGECYADMDQNNLTLIE